MGGKHSDRIRDTPATTRPSSDRKKWRRIVECGWPDYLDPLVVDRRTRADGAVVTTFAPEADTRRLEVQRVARRVYDDPAATVVERRKLIKDYVAQFPHLAFDPNSWFWNIYWTAKAGGAVDKKPALSAGQVIGAVVNGIKANAPAWIPKRRFRDSEVVAAKQYLNTLKKKRKWTGWYKASRETHPSDSSVAERAQNHRARLIDAIERETGYRPSPDQLRAEGLAAVLSIAVSKKFRVPERDLHKNVNARSHVLG